MFKYMQKVLFSLLVLTSFSLIASDRSGDKELSLSIGGETASSHASTPPLSSLRDIREDSVPAEEEAFIVGVLDKSISVISVRGKEIPFSLRDELRHELSDELNIRTKFIAEFEGMKTNKMSDEVSEIEFYSIDGEVYSHIYGSGLGL